MNPRKRKLAKHRRNYLKNAPMEHFVCYKVRGFEGEKEAGPYASDAIESHRADIAGYEGIYDVRVSTRLPRPIRMSF